ncbi:kinase [Cellulophaga sp. F20128]|uniref:kinase n=1 Tax=Cellulophaga sp. F20128 TaxID=2926413 RepID=UPI001FF6D894|nr:kinase [Cellulophaga sp. F20128]MCK0158855.1 kinase [Cellulophaga sp. F20128]
MNNLLYYPYINIPRTNWTARTLLYYDTIGSIVPQNYFYEPDNYEPFMRDLVRHELVIPINPMEVLERPWELAEPFIDYVDSKEFKLKLRRKSFRKGNFGRINKNKFRLNGPRIHVNKFDSEIFNRLEDCGLARRENYEWYIVEQRTANDLMTYLASVIGGKLNYLPTTDKQIKRFSVASNSKKVQKIQKKEQIKREIILRELIPFPEKIDLKQLRKFKDKHSDLLNTFKNRVELIALDPNLDEDTPLFNETIKELDFRKGELSAKMGESKLGNVFFGTVCGISGAMIGMAQAGTTGAVIGGLPAFANAVYSALQIERAENITDQSGMKYLALIDRKIRKPGANTVYSK